jgi:hypothetical protein
MIYDDIVERQKVHETAERRDSGVIKDRTGDRKPTESKAEI